MCSRRCAVSILAVGVLIAGAAAAFGAIPTAERSALIALYDNTGGPGWFNSANWLGPPGSECTWFGIACDPGETHVEGIDLGGNNLIGFLPPDLEDLTMLRNLWLADNQIGGSIPAELGNLANLEGLGIPGNQLAGPIPSSLGNLTNLASLDLGHNHLTGALPAELGNLTSLWLLSLADNRLEGPIPTEIGNLVNLRDLHLWVNGLTGPIPPELGGLSELMNLSIDNNQLEGQIPTEIGSLIHLQWLNLGENNLTGAIPPELGALPELWWMSLAFNQLSGPIPPELGSLAGLRELHLSGNRLSGPIPPELGNLAQLEWLFLSWNELEGPIPPELGAATHLVGISLEENRLSGPIPIELGGLSNLMELRLAGNMISSTIPVQLGNLTQLVQLDLSRNCLDGTIPPEIGGLSALESLQLASNKIVGTIPSQITSLVQLLDGGSSIDFNAVHTGDPAVGAFMDAKFSVGWRDTQTVPPENLAVDWVTGLSAGVSWDPIVYQWDEGGYEIMLATAPSGPYEPYARTLGKQLRRWPIYDLASSATYYVKVCAVTEPHQSNQNTVLSELTTSMAITTTAEPSTWYVATTGLPSNDCATPATPCPTIQSALDRSVHGEQLFVAAGTYHEHLGIAHPIRIVGADAATTVIDAGGTATNVVWVGWGRNLQMSHVTLRNGTIDLGGGVFVAPFGVFRFSDGILADNHANWSGGGLYVDHDAGARFERVLVSGNTSDHYGGGVGSSGGAHVEISESTFAGNIAHWGGGLSVTGYTLIDRTSVDGNVAESYGGGGIATEGMLWITNSTISNNAAAHGGGVANYGGGFAELVNCTVSGNTGGGLFNDRWGRMELESCTIVDNAAPFTEHSGLMNWNELSLHNSIVAANTPFNCANPVTSQGFNLEDGSTCGLDAAGDLSDTDPLLGPLSDNGGPTLTHALDEASSAIDAGDPEGFPPFDQRGWERPLDGNADGFWLPDIGAVEYAGVVFADGFDFGDTTAWSATVP